MPAQTYGQSRVALRPISGVKQTSAPDANVFGSGFAAKVGGIAANVANTMVDAERERADQTAILEANNKLAAWENARLYDPQQGAVTIKGKDAQGVLDVVPQEFDVMAGEIAGGLTSDRQKMEFQKFASSRRVAVDYTLRQHVYGEMQRYDAQESKSFVENMTQTAIASADKPALVGQALNQMEEATRAFALRQGLGPDATAQMLTEQKTSVHMGVIDRLLAQDRWGAAKAYYDVAKDQIAGEKLAGVEKAIEEGTLRAQAQQASDTIAQAPTLTAALEQVRKIEDPKLRDEVQQRVEHEFALKDRIKRDGDEQQLTDLYTKVEKAGIAAVLKDPAWVTLGGGERSALRSYAKSLVEGTGIKTNPATWYRLYQLATVADQAKQNEFAETNLLQFKGVLSDADFKQFAEMQGAIRKGDMRTANQVFATEKEANDMVDEALVKIGANPNPPAPGRPGYNKAESERNVQFRESVRNATAVAERNKGGKKLTTQEVQGIVGNLMTRTAAGKKGWFGGGSADTYAFQPHAYVSTVADVPIAEQQQIREALAATPGARRDDQAIITLYNQKLARLRGERYFPLGAK